MSRLVTTTTGEKGRKPSDNWRTPRALFDAADDEFDFVLDAAADRANHLCPEWFGLDSGAMVADALSVDWGAYAIRLQPRHATVWCNPPYSNITPFLVCAINAAERSNVTVVMLLPYSPSEKWWQWIEDHATEVRRIPGRVKFDRAGEKSVTAMFASCLVVFRPLRHCRESDPHYITWSYK